MVIGAELFLPEEEEFSRELPFLKTTVAVPLEKSNVKKIMKKDGDYQAKVTETSGCIPSSSSSRCVSRSASTWALGDTDARVFE